MRCGCYDEPHTHRHGAGASGQGRAAAHDAAGDARVIPVILRPCAWHGTPFGRLLAVPKDGKPITMYANQDEALLQVAKDVRMAAQDLGKAAVPPEPPAMTAAPTTKTSLTADVRSSNLRVRKTYSDHNRDAFLDDEKTQSAVVHQLLVLGEAAKRVSDATRTAQPVVPWASMSGMRDKLIHDYDAVDLEEVWQTVVRDLPPLVAALTPLVAKTS